jgi:tRNA-splicing ligase RtcB
MFQRELVVEEQKNYLTMKLKEFLKKVLRGLVKNNYGIKEDLEKTEDNGCLPGANVKNVSQRAIARVLPQLVLLEAGKSFFGNSRS